MSKEEQRTGIVFHHRQTEKPALWITQYNPDWKNKKDPNLYRVRCANDIPDMHFSLYDLSLAAEIFDISGKEGLYRYLQAFFYDFCETKKDKKECNKNVKDWWFMLLPSGFPDGVIPDK